MDAGVVVGFKTPGNVWCSGDELTSGWHRIRDRDRTTPDSQLAYLVKVARQICGVDPAFVYACMT